MSILIPSDDFEATTDGPIAWHRNYAGHLYGRTAAAIGYSIERSTGRGDYWVWVSVNGSVSPLQPPFPTSSEAAAYAAEHYTASLLTD